MTPPAGSTGRGPLVFDPERPPAASKVMVHGVGMEGRTMTVDMIAVANGP